ncbi:MAG: hypothetical protein R3A10_03640 [Caldilineaceae bacterium]
MTGTAKLRTAWCTICCAIRRSVKSPQPVTSACWTWTTRARTPSPFTSTPSSPAATSAGGRFRFVTDVDLCSVP